MAPFAVRTSASYTAASARGVTVTKTVDAPIATFCIAEGFELLHANRDFDPYVEHLGLQTAVA